MIFYDFLFYEFIMFVITPFALIPGFGESNSLPPSRRKVGFIDYSISEAAGNTQLRIYNCVWNYTPD